MRRPAPRGPWRRRDHGSDRTANWAESAITERKVFSHRSQDAPAYRNLHTYLDAFAERHPCTDAEAIAQRYLFARSAAKLDRHADGSPSGELRFLQGMVSEMIGDQKRGGDWEG